MYIICSCRPECGKKGPSPINKIPFHTYISMRFDEQFPIAKKCSSDGKYNHKF